MKSVLSSKFYIALIFIQCYFICCSCAQSQTDSVSYLGKKWNVFANIGSSIDKGFATVDNQEYDNKDLFKMQQVYFSGGLAYKLNYLFQLESKYSYQKVYVLGLPSDNFAAGFGPADARLNANKIDFGLRIFLINEKMVKNIRLSGYSGIQWALFNGRGGAYSINSVPIWDTWGQGILLVDAKMPTTRQYQFQAGGLLEYIWDRVSIGFFVQHSFGTEEVYNHNYTWLIYNYKNELVDKKYAEVRSKGASLETGIRLSYLF